MLLLHKRTYYIVILTIVVDCVRSADIVRPSDTFPVVPFPFRVSSFTGRYADTRHRLTPVRATFRINRTWTTVRRRNGRACLFLFVAIFHFNIFNNNIIPLACLSDPSPPPNHPSIIICRPRPLRSGQSRSLISTPKRRRFRRLFSPVLCLFFSNFFPSVFRSFAINIYDASWSDRFSLVCTFSNTRLYEFIFAYPAPRCWFTWL